MDTIENAIAGLKSEHFTSEEIFAEIQENTAGTVDEVHLDFPTELLHVEEESDNVLLDQTQQAR